ncbi:MAG TPA: hypothetical protein VMG32_07570 [Anaeromyxobacteraceae bacterium]|nr:hypothetical protein [Anaeromyxobacteraceae bacterium]
MARACPACGKAQGSNGRCLSCRDAAAKELAREAEDVTDAGGTRRDPTGLGLRVRPPWYARSGAGELLPRLRLLGMVLADELPGRRARPPGRSLARCAAAAAYLALPLDLLPEALRPHGLEEDLLFLALAARLVKRELRAYCAWKGVSPAHFGL